MILHLRQLASKLPTPLRRMAKAAWWAVTPWKIPERLRYRGATRKIAVDYSLAVPLVFSVAPSPVNRLAAIVHIYYTDLVDEIRAYLEKIPFPLDVYISTRNDLSKSAIEESFDGWQGGTVVVRVVPNQGRDIAPKLLAFKDIYSRYAYVLCIHSKRSPHASALASWRHYLFESLCGNADIVRSVMTIFGQYPKIGMIAAQHFDPARRGIHWGDNFGTANELARRMGFELDPAAPLDFPSGSMFWARTASLKPLLDLDLSWDMFDDERGQLDGTLAHAIERLFFHVCEYAGYDWIKISRPDLMSCTPSIVAANTSAELNDFLRQHIFHLLDPGNVRPRTVHPDPIQ
jgi:lipopolysaccharide biosynthesis protein